MKKLKQAYINVSIKKYATFSVFIYSDVNTSGNWKNEKLCGNTTPPGRSVFTKFRVFPISTGVDITVYLSGKNVLYFFYNMAQKNTKLLQWMSDGKFSVFTSSYVNTALNQSAFRIHKCYIIIVCYHDVLTTSLLTSRLPASCELGIQGRLTQQIQTMFFQQL